MAVELAPAEKRLYLTQNPQLIRDQLSGKPLQNVDLEDLRHGISTDTIIPSRFCYQDGDPERLGGFCLVGVDPSGVIEPEAIRQAGFTTVVAGKSFGRGSSREHAQLAFLGAGIQQLVVGGAERIFFDNCLNYGLKIFPLDHPEVQTALANGTPLPQAVYYESLPPISRLIVAAGGLLPFFRARMEGQFTNPSSTSSAVRPMTVSEKIIAAHAALEYVKPGQQVIAKIDRGFAYELQNPVVTAALSQAFPEGCTIPHPESFILFEDHLALFDFPDTKKQAEALRERQREFARRYGFPSYQVDPQEGVEGICHTVMVEKHCSPGELILGNDSHTCTLGVNGAFAIGKGASEMAAAMISGEIVLTVPETIRFDLKGQLRDGVTSKDLMLKIIGSDEFRPPKLIGSGRVFEFGGPGLDSLNFDEQLVLSNITIEGQGATGIVEPNQRTFSYLAQMRGENEASFRRLAVFSDENAEYYRRFIIDLSTIDQMIALPGDTQNTIPLSRLQEQVKVNIAYLGSCTGGKLTELMMAAEVLRGKKIHPDVKMFVQASSQTIRQQAENLGIFDSLRAAGAEVLPPGCGACMGAGPGSCNNGEVIISDTNRNFHGRMGRKGQAYLSNALVVAASAVNGFISTP